MGERTPNIDHLIRQRFQEMGFSDEVIEELMAFARAEAKRIKAERTDDDPHV